MFKRLKQFLLATTTIAFMFGNYVNVAASSNIGIVQKPLATSKIYYVSLSGSDSSAGTSTAPFKTFSKALSLLVPGDELQIYGGTYTQVLNISKSGTATLPITIKAVTGQRVIIDASLANDRGVMLSGNYLVLEGLEVQHSLSFGIDILGSNINVRNVNIHDNNSTGLRVKGKNVIVENSTFHDNVTENLGGINQTSGWSIALRATLGAENVTFRNNTVYNNWGEGISASQAKYINFYNNVVHDNYSINIYIDNAMDVNIENNLVYSTDVRYFRSGQPVNGISMAEEEYSGWGAQLARIRIVNNIVFSCKHGIGYTYAEVTNGGMDTVTIANNTIWGSTDTGILVINQPTKTKNSLIANNIVQQPNGKLANIQVSSGITRKNNFWVNPILLTNASGPGDKTGDVKLAGIPSITPQTYRLSSISPAIGGGASIGVTQDFEGKLRGPLFDMGAIQYAGSIAPTSTLTITPILISVTSTRTTTLVPTITSTRTPTSISVTSTRTTTPALTITSTRTPTSISRTSTRTTTPAPTITSTRTPTSISKTSTRTTTPGPTITSTRTTIPTATKTFIPPTNPSTGQNILNIRIANGNDDVEESSSGWMYMDSTDLELVYDSNSQKVGLRFKGVNIPQGAVITNAYIQFKVDETSSQTISLNIQGEANNNASAFTDVAGNVSSRLRTTSNIVWSPVAWPQVGIAGIDQSTPNLAPIIQEIITRPGWASGNSLVLIITGTTGKRIATAFEEDAAGAPMLHIEYNNGAALSVNESIAISSLTATITATTISPPSTTITDTPTQIVLPTETPISPSPTPTIFIENNETPSPSP